MDTVLPTIQFVERAGILDLGWGHPHPSLLPVERWRVATDEMLRAYGWRALTYGYAAGPGALIEWLASHLRDIRAAETFVTAGASHALELVSTALTAPGDVVVVDSPTYHLALRVLADRGVEVVGAPADDEGLDPDATADLIAGLRRAGRRVPLLYLVPTFGNPTGRSLPSARRDALVSVARSTGVTIVEDDTYRELVYNGPAPPSLWSLSGGEGVVRLGSFAKTVAPGLRLGWVNAAPSLIHRLIGLGYVDSGGGVNHAAALTMATFGASGGYADHVAEILTPYAARRDTLVDALRTAWPDVASPAGGWFVWLPLPPGVRAGDLLPVAERAGVSFVEGSKFYATGAGHDRIRLSYSLLGPTDLIEAARRLAVAVDSVAPLG